MTREHDLAPGDGAPTPAWETGIGAAAASAAAVVACILTRSPDHLLRMAGIGGWIPGLVVVMALVNGARGVARAPFAYASNEQPVSTWATRSASAVASAVGIGALVTVPLYALLRATSWWWLWGWVFFGLVTVAAQVLMPVVMRLRCGQLLDAPPDLAERVRAMEIGIGHATPAACLASAAPRSLAVGGVYLASPKRRAGAQRNAYLLGLGRTRRVVLEAGLAEWPTDLVTQAVAHELGHARLHHTVRRLPVTLALQFLTFALAAAALSWDHLLRWAATPSVGDPRSYPLLLLLTAVAVLPARVALAAYDRRQERAADHFALELLGQPDTFIAMLDRLGHDGDAARALPWWRRLTATHPTIDQRIRYCEMQKEFSHV